MKTDKPIDSIAPHIRRWHLNRTGRGLSAFSGLLAFLVAMVITGQGLTAPLYVVRDLNNGSPIRAYEIQPAPAYLTHLGDSTPTRYGGVGLATDTDSDVLFVTYENSGTLDILVASTLARLGQVMAPGANNLGGIVVEQHKNRVYVMEERGHEILVYNWDAATPALTLLQRVVLDGVVSAYGIALDDLQDRLFVADNGSGTVRIFSTTNWTTVGQFTPMQPPVSIAVNAKRQLVYTGNAGSPVGSVGLLSKYDLVAGVETTLNIRAVTGWAYDNVSGIAVDPDTGLVYVTTKGDAFPNLDGSDQLMVFSSNLQPLYATGDIGHPSGIAIPGQNDPPTLTCPDPVVRESGSSTTLTATVEDPEGDDIWVVWYVDAVPVRTNMVPANPFHTAANVSLTLSLMSTGQHMVVVTATDGYDATSCSSMITVIPIPARIDVKPGSKRNPINLKSKGKLTVAVFSSAKIDARRILANTIRFGDPRLTGRISPEKWKYEDVNKDHLKDLVVEFSMSDARMSGAFNTYSTRAALTGQLASGAIFLGEDSVWVVPTSGKHSSSPHTTNDKSSKSSIGHE